MQILMSNFNIRRSGVGFMESYGKENNDEIDYGGFNYVVGGDGLGIWRYDCIY